MRERTVVVSSKQWIGAFPVARSTSFIDPAARVFRSWRELTARSFRSLSEPRSSSFGWFAASSRAFCSASCWSRALSTKPNWNMDELTAWSVSSLAKSALARSARLCWSCRCSSSRSRCFCSARLFSAKASWTCFCTCACCAVWRRRSASAAFAATSSACAAAAACALSSSSARSCSSCARRFFLRLEEKAAPMAPP